jgi:MFS family permease
MTTKQKAVFSACAASIVGMESLVTTAVLAYIFGAYHNLAPSTILLIMTVTPLVGIFAAFLIGPISMKISKKTLLIVALLATIIAGAIFCFLGGRASYSFMLIAGALGGLVSGTMSTIPNAIVTDYAESPEERGKFCGYTSACLQGGALVMSMVGGILGAIKWQYAYSLYFLAIPLLLIVIFMLPKDTPVQREKTAAEKKSFKHIPPSVYVKCLHYALIFVCVYTFSVNISSYVITEYKLGSSVQSGIAAAILTLSGVIAGVTFSKYVKALKRLFMPIICLLITLGFASTTFLTGTLAGCLIGAILLGFSKVAIVPYVIGQITSTVPRYMTAVTISLLMGCMNLGMFLSIYIVNAVSNPLGGITIHNKFLASTILAAVAFILSIFIYTITGGKNREGKA